jgi:predicted nucleic acid-binding protein
MILIDTAPLVALCDPRDSLNKMALKDLKTLSKSQLAVCEPVVCEVCFHLPALSQRKRLQQIFERLNVTTVVAEDAQSQWRGVFEWLKKYAEHEPDWADAYLAVLCGNDRKYKLWTYDDEFRSVWRRPDGSRIPLAVPL